MNEDRTRDECLTCARVVPPGHVAMDHGIQHGEAKSGQASVSSPGGLRGARP